MRSPASFARIQAVDGQYGLGELPVQFVVGVDPVRGTVIMPADESSESWGGSSSPRPSTKRCPDGTGHVRAQTGTEG